MTDELERVWKEAIVYFPRYELRICLEGLRNPLALCTTPQATIK
jgi:hypothetical protein